MTNRGFDRDRGRFSRFGRESDYDWERGYGRELGYGRGGYYPAGGWTGYGDYEYEPGFGWQGHGRYEYEPDFGWEGYGAYGPVTAPVSEGAIEARRAIRGMGEADGVVASITRATQEPTGADSTHGDLTQDADREATRDPTSASVTR